MAGRRLTPPVSARLADPQADRVQRATDQRVSELQKVPLVAGSLVENVELPDATLVPISHNLGRVARVFNSPPRFKTAPTGSGQIRDRSLDNTKYDPRKYVVLYAADWGATAYVDVWIY